MPMPAVAENILMTDIDGLEEIERQTAFRINEPRPRHPVHNWGISPNIARASVSRESEKPPQAVASIKPTPVDVDDRETFDRALQNARARWMVPIRSMSELLAAHRARRDELGLTHETIDELAGWAGGYAGKVLAPEPIKNLGWQSLGLLHGVFGTMLIMVEDPEQIRRVESRWIRRERPQTSAKIEG
jgi:hypothetical protein